jgi:hypothetical protein
MRRTARLAALLALGALAGCPNAGEDRLLSIGAAGIVRGFVVFDQNGNQLPDVQDSAFANFRMKLITVSARDSIAGDATDANGVFRMEPVPAGTYLVVIDSVKLSDTAVVARMDSTQVTVKPGDSVQVEVTIGYPHVSIRAVRTTVPLGRRVFVNGIALNALPTFSDTTLHVQDTSAAIRMTRVRQAAFTISDSIRVRGTTSQRDGQRTLDDVTVIPLAAAFLPQATVLTTAAAASAASGTRDAQLVQVDSATISDTTHLGQQGLRLTVNDGSGPLEVFLDGNISPAFRQGTYDPDYIPGNAFDFVGLLAPTGTPGVWRLKPRSVQDLVGPL